LVVEAVGNENISSARIGGMDESVLTAVQKLARKLLAEAKKKKSWRFSGCRNSCSMCQLDWAAYSTSLNIPKRTVQPFPV
jgi:hypothetical protein